MIFTKKRKNFTFQLQLEGYELKRVTSTKYLGVIISERLSWRPHIAHLLTKLSKASYILSKVRHYVDLNTLKMIYYALVYPHLSYCITSWGSAPKSLMQPLVTIQNKIVRILTNSEFRCYALPLYFDLKFLTVTDVYNLKLAISIHNVQNNKFTGFNNLIPLKNVHSYNTRLSNKNNYFQNQSTPCSSASIKFWRSIPENIKSSSLASFKTKLKQLLINNYKVS